MAEGVPDRSTAARPRLAPVTAAAVAMVLAAGGSVAGCTRVADGTAGSAPPPSSVSRPSAGATTPGPSTAAAATIAIRDPSGPCRETRTTVEPPADPERLCTYRRMVVGHTLAKGRGSTYLSRLVPTLSVGDRVTLLGVPYLVSDVASHPKTALPEFFYDRAGSTRFLVTCDPDSTYTRWSDGLLHASNNLVVTLTPVRA